MQAVHDKRKKGFLGGSRADKVHDLVPLHEQIKIRGQRNQRAFGKGEAGAVAPVGNVARRNGRGHGVSFARAVSF